MADGDSLLSPSVTRRLIEAYAASPSAGAYQDRGIEQLTRREREVLIHMAAGLSNEQLAEELFISHNTVKTHIKRILSKLARDRAQAVVIAHESGLMAKSYPATQVEPPPGDQRRLDQHWYIPLPVVLILTTAISVITTRLSGHAEDLISDGTAPSFVHSLDTGTSACALMVAELDSLIA